MTSVQAFARTPIGPYEPRKWSEYHLAVLRAHQYDLFANPPRPLAAGIERNLTFAREELHRLFCPDLAKNPTPKALVTHNTTADLGKASERKACDRAGAAARADDVEDVAQARYSDIALVLRECAPAREGQAPQLPEGRASAVYRALDTDRRRFSTASSDDLQLRPPPARVGNARDTADLPESATPERWTSWYLGLAGLRPEWARKIIEFEQARTRSTAAEDAKSFSYLYRTDRKGAHVILKGK